MIAFSWTVWKYYYIKFTMCNVKWQGVQMSQQKTHQSLFVFSLRLFMSLSPEAFGKNGHHNIPISSCFMLELFTFLLLLFYLPLTLCLHLTAFLFLFLNLTGAQCCTGWRSTSLVADKITLESLPCYIVTVCFGGIYATLWACFIILKWNL